MYINKMVFTELTTEQQDELNELNILQFTDYNTTEITADLLQETLEEIEEEQGKDKTIEVIETLNDALGSDVVEMLRKDELDFVLVVQRQ